MKLIYLQPQTEVFSSYSEGSLMAATVESDRNVSGADGTLPGAVGETDGETDPYDGHGQGSGGGGNRSKASTIWDDWE